MGLHDPGVRVGVEDPLQRREVARRLQQPVRRGLAVLHHLQEPPMEVVHHRVVGHVPVELADHRPMRSAEAGQRERHAFDGQVRAQLVDRRELRLHVRPELLLALAALDQARAGVAARIRDRVQHVAPDRAAQGRIQPEQLEQDRGSGARRTGHDDGRVDPLLLDRRGLRDRAIQQQPRAQGAQQLLPRHESPDHMHRRAVDGGDQLLEPRRPSRVAKVTGRRLAQVGDGRRHQLVGVDRHDVAGAPAHAVGHQVQAADPVGSLVALGHRGELRRGGHAFWLPCCSSSQRSSVRRVSETTVSK